MTQEFMLELVKYLFSPAIVVGAMYFLLRKSFDFGGLMKTLETVVSDLESLKKAVHRSASHVDIIKTHLVGTSGLDANLFSPGSPLKLLKAGISLLNKSSFKDIYAQNKQWFIDEIQKYKPGSLADVAEASLKVVTKWSEKHGERGFKEVAFQSGVTLDVLLMTLSIYLRDEVGKELGMVG